MGYTSEVHIAVPKIAEKEMDNLLTKHNLMAEDEYSYKFKKEHHTQRWKEISSGAMVDKSNDIILYQASSLKWYEEYKDVQEISTLIEEYEPSGACIVCVGEDNAVHSDIGDYGDVFNIYMKVELT
mgnify:CR=1 FL=1|tara:strand:+ start:58 stop:435 length:378 start_codon:yes stop_codon:yes gene_type:complete